MITCIALLLWILCGIRFSNVIWGRISPSKFELAAFGTSSGIILGTWTAFILFLFFGHDLYSRIIFLLLPALFLFYRFHLNFGKFSQLSKSLLPRNPLIITATIILILFWFRVSQETVSASPRGVFTGIATNFGDLAENMAFTQYFAWGNPDLQNPLFSGILYRHHFLANFLASLFFREGFNVHVIFQCETFFLGLLATLLYVIFVKRVTGSTACAWASPFLLYASGSLLQILDPQSLGGKIVWPNFLITRMMPQRAFLLGMPALCLTLILFWESWKRSEIRLWIWAGIFTGLMPLLQIFCFLGAAFTGGVLSVFKGPRAFICFGIPMLLAAAPQLFYLSHHAGAYSMIFIPGWRESYKNGLGSFVIFWLQNTGIIWPMALCALAAIRRSQILFYFPFLLLVVLGNTVQLTADMDNNYNLLYICLFGFIPPILLLFHRIWKIPKAGPIFVCLLFLGLTAGGICQILYVLVENHPSHLLMTAEEQNFSLAVKEKTEPKDLILINPTYNHPVFWSGRKVFMGYSGWVWSHSWGSYQGREQIAKSIYQGGAEAGKYIKDYGINIIIVGPKELRAYQINRDFLDKISEKILDTGSYSVYRIRKKDALSNLSN